MASRKKCKIGNLSKMIESELDNYSVLVGLKMQKTIEEVGKETASKVERTAPKRTGDYSETWVSETVEKGKTKGSVVVHAEKPGYRLAHLLEKGHQNRNGGRTKAYPHIEPAEREAVSKIVREMQKNLGNI